MKRFICVPVPKVRYEEVMYIRSDNREDLTYTMATPAVASRDVSHDPRSSFNMVYYDDSESRLHHLANTLAALHPQFNWIIAATSTIYEPSTGPVTVKTKKLTEKGLLP